MKYVKLYESKSGNINLLKEWFPVAISSVNVELKKVVVKYDGTTLIGNLYLNTDLSKEDITNLYIFFQYLERLNNKIDYRLRFRPDMFNGALVEVKLSEPVFKLCCDEIKKDIQKIKNQVKFDL